jgi:transcriptional regulator with XRE-family HTH domain
MSKEVEKPVTRNLDATRSPLAFFGAELRRARVAAGLSQEQLGRQLRFSHDLVSKIETGEKPPTPAFASGCDAAFPHLDGIFARLLGLARRWDGPYPQWFRDWVQAEREATSLRTWQPMLVPGLFQTADYARAILGAGPQTVAAELEPVVAARIERQTILDRATPPTLWVVLDEAVLHRCVGSPKIMHEQLLHLADLADRPTITIQVVPSRVGVHAGLLGAFIIAGFDGAPDIVYLETSANGQVAETHSVVAQVTLRFDTLRAVALPKDDSRDLILKVADERWQE